MRAPGGRGVVAIVGRGAPYPALAHRQRRARGAFDTPLEMARRVAAASVAQVDGPLRRGLDPACGTGAFLLALHELGVPEVMGTDLDEVALAVARVVVPSAHIERGDALAHGPEVDLVAGNPPFVPPERQDKALRAALRRRFPWLRGRFDLVVPFAAAATARVRPGGAVGLVLPAPAMVQPYGATLRRRWVERHRIAELSGPHAFPGASVHVMLVVLRVGAGRHPLPAFGLTPDEILRLDNVPLDPDLMPGDVDLFDAIRARSVPLSSLARVDTGVVAHGPHGPREALLHDEPGPGRVPYADARDYFAGARRWLEYRPDLMHRAKTPELFEHPKLVIQRLRGRGSVRAAADLDGTYVGHTCTVVSPDATCPVPLERLLALVRSPLVDGLTRIERGQRLDLYPRDVGAFPVPRRWLTGDDVDLVQAWELEVDQIERLEAIARRT